MKKLIFCFTIALGVASLVSCGNGKSTDIASVKDSTELDNSMQKQEKSNYGIKSVSTETSGDAYQCNVCSCKQYNGGSGTSDKCSCGHAKHQHYWH